MWFNCVKSLTQISFAFEYKIIKKTWAVFKESNLFRQPWYTPKWKVRRQYSAPAMRKGGSFYNCIWCLTSYHCHQGRLRDAFRMRQKPNSARTHTHAHMCVPWVLQERWMHWVRSTYISPQRALCQDTWPLWQMCCSWVSHTDTQTDVSISHANTVSLTLQYSSHSHTPSHIHWCII